MNVPLTIPAEESRAHRLARQQARLRDRGGIFVPSGDNPLLEKLLARTVSGESPSRANKRRSASASPTRAKSSKPSIPTKAGPSRDDGAVSAKKKLKASRKSLALKPVVENECEDEAVEPALKPAKGRQKAKADAEDESQPKKRQTKSKPTKSKSAEAQAPVDDDDRSLEVTKKAKPKPSKKKPNKSKARSESNDGPDEFETVANKGKKRPASAKPKQPAKRPKAVSTAKKPSHTNVADDEDDDSDAVGGDGVLPDTTITLAAKKTSKKREMGAEAKDDFDDDIALADMTMTLGSKKTSKKKDGLTVAQAKKGDEDSIKDAAKSKLDSGLPSVPNKPKPLATATTTTTTTMKRKVDKEDEPEGSPKSKRRRRLTVTFADPVSDSDVKKKSGSKYRDADDEFSDFANTPRRNTTSSSKKENKHKGPVERWLSPSKSKPPTKKRVKKAPRKSVLERVKEVLPKADDDPDPIDFLS